MRKIIAAINMTLDGVCDHTALNPAEEIHEHYKDLLNSADVILYGRITYGLMGFWQELLKNPSGEKSMDDFAVAMDRIQKIVFSRQLKNLEWDSATLATQSLQAEALELKQQPGKDILVGSRSLLLQLLNLQLLDELQICLHPLIAGDGLPLFDKETSRTALQLNKTKRFASGAVILNYVPLKQQPSTAPLT